MIARLNLFAAARVMIAAAAFSVAAISAASAHIGPSFMQMPGIAGGWQGEKYKDWIRIESNYWEEKPIPIVSKREHDRTYFSGPWAPRQGANQLAIAVDKRSPALQALMDQCRNKAKIPEVTYAESADLARRPMEVGPRPAEIPEYFEYKLIDVHLECPVLAAAPEQAIVLKFSDIQWLNYDGAGMELTTVPAKLGPARSSGKSKVWVVTWYSVAADAKDDQCPAMNAGPIEADYYALMSPDAAAKERAFWASKGGVTADTTYSQLPYRGPGKLNACLLPGILPDSGHVAPVSDIAHGLDLDGNDGTGDTPAGTRKHKNYVSEDGRSGIDNQLFSVYGCVRGFKRTGFIPASQNERRRTGMVSMLVQVSGIDDEQNDDHVDVTLFYSKDTMVKDASGTQALPNYTFRVADDDLYPPYFVRLSGRIVDGVVTTESIPRLTIIDGREPRLQLFATTLADARMRFQMKPDGTIKGVIGGYQDWRVIANYLLQFASAYETNAGYKCQALYNAFKRAADGLKDPVSGEFTGISAAYDIEGIPAFLPPSQRKDLIAQAVSTP